MVWRLSDPYGVEEDLEEMGTEVWRVWLEDVMPDLLSDPTATNQMPTIERTTNDLVWLPGTDVYVRFELISDNYVLLIEVLNLMDLT